MLLALDKHLQKQNIFISIKENIINNFARITQFISWPILALFFYIFFKLEINDNKNIKSLKSPFIVVSNHIAFYDSFLFRLVPGIFASCLPLRFMAVDIFDVKFLNILAKFGVIDLLYSLFGVFTVKPGLGISKNLEKAKSILYLGGNVVIYAEGSISPNYVGKFKNGAVVLAKSTNVPIIPISIRLKNNDLRKKIVINVGVPVRIKASDSIKDETNKLRLKIIDLYNKNA